MEGVSKVALALQTRLSLLTWKLFNFYHYLHFTCFILRLAFYLLCSCPIFLPSWLLVCIGSGNALFCMKLLAFYFTHRKRFRIRTPQLHDSNWLPIHSSNLVPFDLLTALSAWINFPPEPEYKVVIEKSLQLLPQCGGIVLLL